MKKTYRHELEPDYQAFDEVSIVTKPRFKTSGLSGDEWRISAVVRFIKKGVVVAERSFNKVDTAIELLSMMRVQWSEMGEGDVEGSREKVRGMGLCDQEGCINKATVFYELKARACRYCGDIKPVEEQEYLGIPYAKFCDDHKHRGDSDLQDNDKNYIEISDPTKG